MSDDKKDKKITVTLTDRPPVTIRVADWPLIAKTDDHDNQHECQANTLWAIRVRQHKDGRTLVYGWQTSGNGGQHIGYRPIYVGYLLLNGEDVVRAIRDVGDAIGNDLADYCIADLPAEELA